MKNRNLLKCFGCGENLNIFHVANYTQDLPLNGEEFWSITIPSLCKQLNVPFEETSISPELKEKIECYKAYAKASEIITNSTATNYLDYLTRRNIIPDIAKLMGIGTVESFEKYKALMLETGYTEAYLTNIGLLNPIIFRVDYHP